MIGRFINVRWGADIKLDSHRALKGAVVTVCTKCCNVSTITTKEEGYNRLCKRNNREIVKK